MHNINKQPKRRRRPVESSNRKVRPLQTEGLNSEEKIKSRNTGKGIGANKFRGSSIQK